MSDNVALHHYLSRWQLSNPQPLAQTATSHLYTVTHNDATVVLKILTPYGIDERIGALALGHFKGHGAVHLLQSDDDAQLLEYADGENLTGLVKEGHDAEATAIIGDVINALHETRDTPPAGMTPLRHWFRALFSQAEQDRQKGLNTIVMRAASTAEAAFAQPYEPRVLHGDIHHENIRHSPRGWLAFDPKGLYGERTYDLANTLCNPRPIYGVVTTDENRILRNATVLSETCGIERSRIMLFLHLYACLTVSWTLQGAVKDWDLRVITRVAEIAEQHM